MRITPEVLEKQWGSINYTDGGFLQIDTLHPLEWYIGYQSISQRTLLLVSDNEIGAIDSSRSMVVTRRRRETDNRWTLSFELLRNEQQGVFAILCSDVIEHSRSANDEKEALKLVLGRYKQWSKLLESQNSGLMSEQSQKGLIGELLFLEKQITILDTPLTAIQGWAGADGADQDFVYPERWHEVKSIGISATNVSISSLEQLDCVDMGELIIQRLDKATPSKTGAFSLNEVVLRISNTLASNVDALDLFRAKLSAYGYIDLLEYSEQKYFHTKTEIYRVDETFPKLTVKSIPSQIVSANYELNLPSLTDWRKE